MFSWLEGHRHRHFIHPFFIDRDRLSNKRALANNQNDEDLASRHDFFLLFRLFRLGQE